MLTSRRNVTRRTAKTMSTSTNIDGSNDSQQVGVYGGREVKRFARRGEPVEVLGSTRTNHCGGNWTVGSLATAARIVQH